MAKRNDKEYKRQWRLNNIERSQEYQRRWRADNMERSKEIKKKYRDSKKGRMAKKKCDDSEKGQERRIIYAGTPEFKERSKWWYMKRRYNITQEGYNELFDRQDGCCVICKKHQKDIKKALFVDHDHVTGKIRGLLCVNCNTLLGHAFDNVDILNNAITYLKYNT